MSHSASQACRIELNIASDAANLRQVRQQLERFAADAGLNGQKCEELGLAVNEALANVIRHGYGGAKDCPIRITAEQGAGEVRLSIRDWGKPFDPAELPMVKTPVPGVDPVRPGGLGLLCIRKLMDQVRYVPLPDGMLLELVKRS